jgi:glycine/D-amino acid oxidase-like deaminating enzyme
MGNPFCTILGVPNMVGNKVVIVGGGWAGCQTALELAAKGYDVTIVEKNKDIFSEISGKYGIRLHNGGHYLRSPVTRASCYRGYDEFIKNYEHLLRYNQSAVYGLAAVPDVDGNLPKVTPDEFRDVAREIEGAGIPCQLVDARVLGYKNLANFINSNEPGVACGWQLREDFRNRLANAGVKIVYETEVTEVEKLSDETYSISTNNEQTLTADYLVNATYFQSRALLPKKELPLGIKVVYQPSLTFRYADIESGEDATFSITVMDGKYVCLMPRAGHDTPEDTCSEYTLYHAKYTILDTFDNPEDAHKYLDNLLNDPGFPRFTDAYRRAFEDDMERFYPGFRARFMFTGKVDTGVGTKFETEKDMRSAVVFEDEEMGIKHIFSGKINNVMEGARAVHQLMVTPKEDLIHVGGYAYARGSEFDHAIGEMIEKPKNKANSTSHQIDTIREFAYLLARHPSPKRRAEQEALEAAVGRASAKAHRYYHQEPAQHPSHTRHTRLYIEFSKGPAAAAGKRRKSLSSPFEPVNRHAQCPTFRLAGSDLTPPRPVHHQTIKAK